MSFLFLLISGELLAQRDSISSLFPIDSITHEISYSKVVVVDSATQDELYRRAKNWIADAYRSAQSVIQLDDKENGTIVIKGVFTSYLSCGMAGAEWTINHTMKIQVKDRKYRYYLSDFTVDPYGNSFTEIYTNFRDGKVKYCKKGYPEMLSSVASQSQATVRSLEAAMKKAPDKW